MEGGEGAYHGRMVNRVRVFADILQQGGLYLLLFLLPFSNAACEISFGFIFTGWMLDRWVAPSYRDRPRKMCPDRENTLDLLPTFH